MSESDLEHQSERRAYWKARAEALEAQATLDREHLTRVVAERAALEAERDEAIRERDLEDAIATRLGEVCRCLWDRAVVAEERSRQLAEELKRQHEMWSIQSGIIRALAAEVPDEVRARVLAPLASLSRDSAEREETHG